MLSERDRPSFNSAQAAFEAALTSNLLGAEQTRWIKQTNIYCDRLSPFTTQNQFPRLLICQTEPIELLAGFMAACISQCPMFLGNPNWSAQEWQGVLDLVQPHQIWGTVPIPTPPNLNPSDAKEKGWIMIPTGGSSGHIKFAIHTWATLTASVQGFQRFFGFTSINSCCVLPLYHVSGLTQFLRSLLTQGHLHIIPFASLFNNHSHEESRNLSSSPPAKTAVDTQGLYTAPPVPQSFGENDSRVWISPPKLGGLGGLMQGVQKNSDYVDSSLSKEGVVQSAQTNETPQQYFLSLVPTQLQRLLQQPMLIPWLQQFHTILLGGAPAWPTLLQQAKQHQLNLAPTYGMTETASQVVTLKPQDFLQGRLDAGTVLPHAQIEILDQTGQPIAIGQIGTIALQAKSLFQGYYPNHSPESRFQTDDRGYFDGQNHLHLTGRSSRKIISGGENIYPEEVEAALHNTGQVNDVYVTGLPDEHWGEAIVTFYVPQHPGINAQTLKAALEDRLSRYKHPKQWLSVEEIPRNAQGKVDQLRLLHLLTTTTAAT
jgi:o-succinylbenzoate---CoA ligase